MRWGEKPYHSLDYELKKQFGEKVYKLALNGGMTCPNRDGKVGTRGCIFCSQGGSGDFAASASLSISEQIDFEERLLLTKRPVKKYIAYFQAYTNTYGEPSYLRKIFTEAISRPEIAALSIATRPDCLSEEILDLLEELNHQKPVWVELGLQTIHEKTASFIRRGYPLSCFETAVHNLHLRRLTVIVHVILGLPGETKKEMLETISYLNHQPIQGIKLQLLHILKQTDLADYYTQSPFSVMTMEEYIDVLIGCIERLSPDIVIHRITGDGPRELLIAPLWSLNKRTVLNSIHAAFRTRASWQGRIFSQEETVCRNHSHYIS